MSNQNKAYVFALLAVVCWSTVGTAFKLTLYHTDNFNMLLWSVPFALLINILFSIKELNLFFHQSFRDIMLSSIGGFLNPFLYYLILFKAYNILPAQEALSLNYLWPIVLVIFSIPILKQKISITGFIAILISFSGSIFIATRGDFSNFKFSDSHGVLLALSSTVIWALFWIINIYDKRKENIKLTGNFFFGLLYIFIFGIISNKIVIPNIYGIAGAAYIGIFEMGLTFFLWLKALSLSETTAKVSNLIFLSPFLSLIFIAVILNEPLKLSTIIGLILIVLGIFIQRISTKNSPNN